MIIVSATGKIVKLDTNGREILSIGLGADVETFHPFLLSDYPLVTAVDTHDNIYVLTWDGVNAWMNVFSRDGKLVAAWGSICHPMNQPACSYPLSYT